MRVLIAPDSFSGTMTAAQAAAAIAQGWLSGRPDDEVIQVPMADGGEGLTDVVAGAVSGAVVQTVEVADARGIAREARWVQLPDGTAVVEVAEACGLSHLAAGQRDPLRTTTYGVGQLLRAALGAGPDRLVVGLGGSATVDGGAGMLSALGGHGLRRADGNGVKVGGRWVAEVVTVRPLPVPDVPVVIASDVDAPLLGPSGAATVFGPQKGADPDGVRTLEAALRSFADVVERDLPGGPWRDRPGAGAAGGLGFALMAAFDATVRQGAAVVADLVGLDATGMDVVVTGEGSLDAQTLGGKVPELVRSRGRQAGAVVLAVAGRIEPAAAGGFDDHEVLGARGLTAPIEAARTAGARLARRA